jgi:cob(I)alamin adenosyltransferase
MSIVTKTGDSGTTGMLFGARVSKSHKCIAAVGDIDELNAAIGMIKPFIEKSYSKNTLNISTFFNSSYRIKI